LLTACSQSDEDIFTGVYESESRTNFGTSIPGEVRIEVSRDGQNYLLKYFRGGKPLFTTQGRPCDPRRQTFLGPEWKNANVSALCSPSGANMLVYTEKGLPVQLRGRVFRGRYYAHVQFAFYAFRKIKYQAA
jgi:hemin uptake protein HemP